MAPRLNWGKRFGGMSPSHAGLGDDSLVSLKPHKRKQKAKAGNWSLSPIEIAKKSRDFWFSEVERLREAGLDESEALRHTRRFEKRIKALADTGRT